ncbi:histidine phosphatase family protein [Microbulbifer sp. OS29]|uniref:Histidine phosphatase family protein n=1 Tax=Microbulbifer okhotskensis TaxID=2926617 RepID=A0A9X2ENT6_9GAMM|nr:histidine phosphatase family protein [Microbulbifer okhotskensis]MCO1334580.1 histidine phosphatase family protein [Microbulbifer okhotskensis]
MAKIFLVRHGEADKGVNVPDPALTELRHKQSESLANKLSTQEKIHLISSPKLRAQQTAKPLADLWDVKVVIEDAVTEIPAPQGLPLGQRLTWIRTFLDSDWDQIDQQQSAWRRRINDFLATISKDTIVFCHFMVINSVVAHLRGHQKVKQFRPDYTSITELHNNRIGLHLVSLGEEKGSQIL